MSTLHDDRLSRPTDCGRFVRFESAESKGPRGGRRTLSTAICVDCGQSETVQDTRPGNGYGQHDARTALGKRTCAKPREPSPHTQALWSVAVLLDRRERPGVACAMDLTARGGNPRSALHLAWKYCDSGFAMTQLLWSFQNYHAHPARLGWPWVAHLSADGGTADIQIVTADGVRVGLHGSEAVVAKALRRHLPALAWDSFLAALGLGGAT